MKKAIHLMIQTLIILTILITLKSTPIHAQTTLSTQSLNCDHPKGQILYYNFQTPNSAIVEDLSGHGNDAMIRNYQETGVQITPTVIKGVRTNSLHLPGGASGSYLELPAGFLDGETELTISAWVNLHATAWYQRIWDFGNNQSSYLYLLSNGNNEGFKGYAAAITNQGWTEEDGVQKGSDFPRNTWIFTTVTIQDHHMTLYEDGEIIGEAVTETGLGDLGGTVKNYFGRGQFSDDPMNGELAEISIYNYAMDKEQVASMYQDVIQEQADPANLQTDPDRFLYSYRQNYQADTKGARPFAGWENPAGLLRGKAAGEWLSNLSGQYQEQQEESVKEKAEYLIHELRTLQLKSEELGWGAGYLGACTPEQIALLEKGDAYPQTGAPYAAMGSLMNGLLDAGQILGNQEALETARDLGDWILRRSSGYTGDQKKLMWSQDISGDTGALGGALARLSVLEDQEKYLKGAWDFVYMDWYEAMQEGRDRMSLLSVRAAVSQAETLLEIAEADRMETKAARAAENFWDMAVESYTYATGMTGVDGRFRTPSQIAENTVSRREKNKEICRSMLELTWKLHKAKPGQEAYLEYYENLLYNQMAAEEGIGEHPKIRAMEAKNQTVTINLYHSEEKVLKEKGLKVTMQAGGFREEAVLKIEGQGKKKSGTIRVRARIPSWCRKEMKVWINGNEAEKREEQGYWVIPKLLAGDEVRIFLPYTCYLKENAGLTAAVMYGPFVMITEAPVFKDTLVLTKKVTDMAEPVKGDMLALKINGKTFIPYAASVLTDRRIYYRILYTDDPKAKWHEVRVDEKDGTGGRIQADRELAFDKESVMVQTFPKEGYTLHSLTVNGKEVKVRDDGTCEILKVTENLNISGSFIQKNPLVPNSDSLEQTAQISAHYTASWENLNGVKDAGFHPASSNEGMGKGWGNWQQPSGASCWIAYAWQAKVTCAACEIYWYDDEGETGMPSDFWVEYLDQKGNWKKAVMKTSSFGALKKDQYNTVSFEPVTTKGLRLVMTVADQKRAIGIYRWKVSERNTE